MIKIIKRHVNTYKDFFNTLDGIDEKLFWCVVPLSLVVGIVSVIGTIHENLGAYAILSGVLCIIQSIVMLIICHKDSKHCARYYAIFCLILNCITMPVTFLANGGIESGMPMYCIGSLILCAFCSDKRTRMRTFLISFAAMICLFIVNLLYPGISVPLVRSFIKKDIALSFVLIAISLEIIIANVMIQVSTQRYRSINSGIIGTLGSIIEFRSFETGDHAYRIQRYTEILLKYANELIPGQHFTHDEIQMISSAAILHDIGKISIPDIVLNKPSALTEDEFGEIKKHPIIGCEMIETMRDFQNHKYFDYCYQICRHHHEKYDGSGYPDGLKGEEIPIVAQIVSVVDVYDALTTKRIYKKAYRPDDAFKIILESKGQFSPDMIRCLTAAKPRIDEIIAKEIFIDEYAEYNK